MALSWSMVLTERQPLFPPGSFVPVLPFLGPLIPLLPCLLCHPVCINLTLAVPFQNFFFCTKTATENDNAHSMRGCFHLFIIVLQCIYELLVWFFALLPPWLELLTSKEVRIVKIFICTTLLGFSLEEAVKWPLVCERTCSLVITRVSKASEILGSISHGSEYSVI